MFHRSLETLASAAEGQSTCPSYSGSDRPQDSGFNRDLGHSKAGLGWTQHYRSAVPPLRDLQLYNTGSSLIVWPHQYLKNPVHSAYGVDAKGLLALAPKAMARLESFNQQTNSPAGFVLDEQKSLAPVDVGRVRSLRDLVRYRKVKSRVVRTNLMAVTSVAIGEVCYDLSFGERAENMLFVVRCSGVRSIYLSVECRSRTSPLLYSSGHSGSIVTGQSQTFQAGFQGKLGVFFSPNRSVSSDEVKIELEAYYLSTDADDFRFAARPETLGHWRSHYGCQAATRAIRVGTATISSLRVPRSPYDRFK